MKKEIISDYQGIAIIALFLLGTSSMMMSGLEAKRDFWLAILLSILFATVFVLIFVRLQVLYPGKNLFEICLLSFGPWSGRFLVILLTWFAFHAGMLGLLETVFFIITTSLQNTPDIVLILSILFLVVSIVKEGIEVMGRSAGHIIVYVLGFIYMILMGLIPQMQLENLSPFFYGGIFPVLEGAFTSFTFPMGEIILIPMILNVSKPWRGNLKIYLLGLYIGGITILVISTASVLVLGIETASILNYPSYVAGSRVRIGVILRGAEIFMAIILVSGSFIHLSVFLMGASKGLAALTKRQDYRLFVVPVALFMANLTYSWEGRLIDYFEWEANIWPYYAVSFQALFPIIILLGAELKSMRRE